MIRKKTQSSSILPGPHTIATIAAAAKAIAEKLNIHFKAMLQIFTTFYIE